MWKTRIWSCVDTTLAHYSPQLCCIKPHSQSYSLLNTYLVYLLACSWILSKHPSSTGLSPVPECRWAAVTVPLLPKKQPQKSPNGGQTLKNIDTRGVHVPAEVTDSFRLLMCGLICLPFLLLSLFLAFSGQCPVLSLPCLCQRAC